MEIAHRGSLLPRYVFMHGLFSCLALFLCYTVS